MASMQLARASRRGFRLSRDHIADGEAVRVTHFPDALVSALRKVGGRGAFPGSERCEAILFDGTADHEGGSHPAIADRIAAITQLAGGMINASRLRRDTRPGRAGAPVGFGRRGVGASGVPVPLSQPTTPWIEPMRPLVEPEKPSLAMLGLLFTDGERFWKWQNACIDWYEWREEDRRNVFGLKPKMIMPIAASVTFLLIFHWPADGDFTKMRSLFSPMALVDMARKMDGGTFCSGPSYPDNKCPGA
jgi:hypothetical protein